MPIQWGQTSPTCSTKWYCLPYGITIFPFSQGKALCWDATCVNTFAESSINYSAIEAGHAAAKTENLKRAKYPGLASRFRFESVAIKTSRSFGPSIKNIVYEIDKLISEKNGDKKEPPGWNKD